MNADQFYARLIQIVRPGTPDCLLWSSELDEPIQVIRLPWWKVAFLAKQPVMWTRLARQITANGEEHPHYKRWCELYEVCGTSMKEAKRERPFPDGAQFDYYLIARFGWEWVGIKTLLIET